MIDIAPTDMLENAHPDNVSRAKKNHKFASGCDFCAQVLQLMRKGEFTMLSYIGPIVSLATGIIGIIFSSSGGRQKLSKISYVLLCLVLLSGTASIVGVYNANSEAKAKEDLAANEKRVLDTNMRRNQAMDFFAEKTEVGASLYIGLSKEPPIAGQSTNIAFNLYPLTSSNVRKSTIEFRVSGIVDLQYNLHKEGNNDIIVANHALKHECRLFRPFGEQNFKPAAKSKCNENVSYEADPYFGIERVRTLTIDLPNNIQFPKMLERIEQYNTNTQAVGSLNISTRNEETRNRVLDAVRQSKIYLRLYRKSNELDKDGKCSVFLDIVFMTKPQAKDSTDVEVKLLGIESSKLTRCAFNPHHDKMLDLLFGSRKL